MPSASVTLCLALGALLVASAGRGEQQPDGYRVRATSADGELLIAGDAGSWQPAQIIEWGPEAYVTTFRALHTGEGLWVRFDALDPSPWHTLTERDARLWNEEVVEIFVDPDGDGANYAELEINPANVVTDLLIFEGQPSLRSDIVWDFAGLRSRVTTWAADGARRGWTAIALMPWSDFATLPDTDVSLPPRPGDRWRFNVFRIKRPGGPEEPERDAVYAAWSPPPGPSFHVPEVFRTLEFEE